MKSPKNYTKQTMTLSWSTVASLLLLLLVVDLSLPVCQAKDWNRHNLFDPIYSFDDVDAHYVSPSLTSSSAPSTTTLSAPAVDNNHKGAEEQLKTLLRQSKDDNGASLSSRPVTIKGSPGQASTLAQATTASLTLSSTPGVSATTQHTVDDEPLFVRREPQKRQEEPHYWSALENYYLKMQRSQQPQFPADQQHQFPTYKIVQQEIDDSPGEYKPQHYPSGNVLLFNNYQHHQRPPAATKQDSSAFFLPMISSSNSQQEPPAQHVIVQDQIHYAPSVSRTGGIGSGGVLNEPTFQLTTSKQQSQQPKNTHHQRMDSFPTQQQQSINNEQQTILATVGEDGKIIKYDDLRNLPELLFRQQQQQRIRHQEDTFGSWYDAQRTREHLQEEAFCGLRNRLHATPVGGGRQPNGEYPSHMGLYNGTISDDNFLCAASWIHERFALTLASCVKDVHAPGRLLFRLGEWNLNRTNQSQLEQRTAITGQVDQINIFPKYHNDSVDHNLALIRFAKPVDFLMVPYVSPACQLQSRSSLRTSSCWAPSRNVSLVEYFDAEGEGETKEKRSVGMVELPVRLMANSDSECQRETRIELFNFQHPNYICSADYRKSAQRAHLNTSDTFGSGIYCDEGGYLSLVSIVHPIHPNSSSAIGYLDLTYYQPWMRNIISGRSY